MVIGGAILNEAALTFLGIAIQPLIPSWDGLRDALDPWMRPKAARESPPRGTGPALGE